MNVLCSAATSVASEGGTESPNGQYPHFKNAHLWCLLWMWIWVCVNLPACLSTLIYVVEYLLSMYILVLWSNVAVSEDNYDVQYNHYITLTMLLHTACVAGGAKEWGDVQWSSCQLWHMDEHPPEGGHLYIQGEPSYFLQYLSPSFVLRPSLLPCNYLWVKGHAWVCSRRRRETLGTRLNSDTSHCTDVYTCMCVYTYVCTHLYIHVP